VSRKITKIVTSKQVDETEEIIETAGKFASTVRSLIEEQNFRPEEVFNADQSGFPKEIHAGRSLETKGEKHVEAIAQSIIAGTHSYTVMPTINAAGQLMSPLLICLQERGGSFPQRGIFQVCLYPRFTLIRHLILHY
jgi:hypothetical protein